MPTFRVIHFQPHRAIAAPCALLALALGLALAGCGSSKERKLASYDPESFASTDTHARVYAASEGRTCEAA
ncbi:MAG: hypothetical protein JSS56_20700, partial [Proteobacteria bacterium]|nr:hypothetical protein [Pseudomonadota bacterium]